MRGRDSAAPLGENEATRLKRDSQPRSSLACHIRQFADGSLGIVCIEVGVPFETTPLSLCDVRHRIDSFAFGCHVDMSVVAANRLGIMTDDVPCYDITYASVFQE